VGMDRGHRSGLQLRVGNTAGVVLRLSERRRRPGGPLRFKNLDQEVGSVPR
jgi:hypothetical protein